LKPNKLRKRKRSNRNNLMRHMLKLTNSTKKLEEFKKKWMLSRTEAESCTRNLVLLLNKIQSTKSLWMY
jgi:hypothetical protein